METRKKNAAGIKVAPIELLLLGTLRFLGRGWTLDDLEEQMMISQETHRCFCMHIYYGVLRCFTRSM